MYLLVYPLIAPVIGAALIGLLGSVLGIGSGLFNRRKMSKAEREAMKYQDELADENADIAYQRQRQLQESYFSPAAQLQSQAAGYDSLGLNRMLMAGNGAGAVGSNVPQSSGSSQSSPRELSLDTSSILGAAIQGFQMKQEKELMQQRIDIERMNIKAQASFLRQQTEAKRLENMYLEDYLKNRNANILASTEQAQANADLLRKRGVEQNIINTYCVDREQAVLNKIRADKSLSDAQREYTIELARNQPKLRDKMDAEISRLFSLSNLDASQANYVDKLGSIAVEKLPAELADINQRIEYYGKQIGLTDKQIKWYTAQQIAKIVTDAARVGASVYGASKLGMPASTSVTPIPDSSGMVPVPFN